MDKLLPCPFCGDTATLWQTNDNHGYWWVSCSGAIKTDGTPSCYACMYPYQACHKTKKDAIATWNRRPEPENKPKTNADRIRSMTDGELAQILISEPIAETIPFCQNKPECERLLETESGVPESMCAVCALDWLQKPVEGEKR